MFNWKEFEDEVANIIPDNSVKCLEALMRHRLHLLKLDYLQAMQDRRWGKGKPKKYAPIIPFHEWADGWANLLLAVELGIVFPHRVKADTAYKKAQCNKALAAMSDILAELKVTAEFAPFDGGKFTIKLYAHPR